MKLVTVFNTAGISGKENVGEYIGRIHSILNQKEVYHRVILSSCKNKPSDLERVRAEFGHRISYCSTDELLTVNQTFNLACLNAIREFGIPDGFLYIDSGVHFEADWYSIAKMVKHHKSGPWAMTAVTVSEDIGFGWIFPGQTEDQIFKGELLDMPLGKTVNLHCQIFDKRLVEAFGRPLPDVQASYATESCFTFLCAAIGRRFGVWRSIRPRHDMSMDGASSGFPEGRCWHHTLPCAPRNLADIMADPERYESGLGYEIFHGVAPFKPECYNADESCKDPERLKKFIRENLFLPESHFDYKKISHDWRA